MCVRSQKSPQGLRFPTRKTYVTQVEETFMRHVIRHWQGSLSEMDSSAAMQMDEAMEQAAIASGMLTIF